MIAICSNPIDVVGNQEKIFPDNFSEIEHTMVSGFESSHLNPHLVVDFFYSLIEEPIFLQIKSYT